ncbi:MAG: hypothetical protein R6W82_08295 [bacterium]
MPRPDALDPASSRTWIPALIVLALAILWSAAAAPQAAAQSDPVDPELIMPLEVRNIGPANMGGRIDDIEVPRQDPSTIWMGHASGGVFKSTNHGTTWEAVFDDAVSTSIADIAIAPSNPSVVYVGTGEQNNRQSSSWGNGVYKTEDGGKSWIHLGLEDTGHIGRIRVHPTDPDIVWVGAAGRLWGPNPERGVYMSTDGGRSWEKTLFVSEDTGIIDLVVDPESPNILLAGAYQRRRTGFGFNGGGPEGGIFKSTDGGRSWRKLTEDLPAGPVGRIGLDIYRADTDIVYAIIECNQRRAGQVIGGERVEEPRSLGGVYRSEDKGETWTHQSTTNPRPMYYSQIRVDPNNDLHVWVLGTRMHVSTDAGRTFTTDMVRTVHVDHHALWWDPDDSKHIIIGNDGGLDWTRDGGQTWVDVQTLALAQFYEISADDAQPFYNVYGGLQDNGSWAGVSGNYWRIGITNRDWMTIRGGDGFYTVPDPFDRDIVYAESQNGNLSRVDMTTLQSTGIRPEPPEPPEGQEEEDYRFNWNSPLEVSRHVEGRIYYGGNRLFISNDRGDTWERTPDLTKQIDRSELEIMGVKVSEITLSRNDGISTYGNITTISESPITPDILWAGTDDGNLQVSRDGGSTWDDVTDRVREVPERTYVTRIEASRFAEGRAYVTFDGHRNDDFTPYVLVTEDFGRSWRSISAGIPEGSTANSIREHHRNPNLLFLATEQGAWWSYDRGASWQLFENGLPRVPVDDIFVHAGQNDLLFGTHARGIYIMDDIAPLEGMSSGLFERPLTLFDVRPTWRFERASHLQDQGDFFFRADNPPYGAVISYFLPEVPEGEEQAEIVITDASGGFVRSLEGPLRRGLNRITWDLAHGAREEQAMRGGGPEVVPGTYTVTVSAAGTEVSDSVEVRMDPRLEGRWDLQQLIALRDAQLELMDLMAALTPASEKIADVREQFRALRDLLQDKEDVPQAVSDAVERLGSELKAMGDELFGGSWWRADTVEGRLMRLFYDLSGLSELPADAQAHIQEARTAVEEAIARVNSFLRTRVPEFNRTLSETEIEFIHAPDPVPPPGTGR